MESISRYETIKKHWDSLPSTIESVLNGFPELNKPDIEFSNKLLEKLEMENRAHRGYILDCAAGIGRVSEFVLVNHFDKIDMFEQDEKFVKDSKNRFKDNKQVANIIHSNFQDFQFRSKGKYDAIWIQWSLESLSNNDISIFMKKCFNGLKDDGLVIIKENCSIKNEKVKKKDIPNDIHSPIHSSQFFMRIFRKCGFKIEETGLNDNWPKEFLPVRYFLLRKKKTLSTKKTK